MSHAANPRAPKPQDEGIPQEPTGPVAADSLAAESIRDHEKFSDNVGAVPLGVKGGQSTLATTDTSGATVLPSATDAAHRADAETQGAGADERGTTGVKYPDGNSQSQTRTQGGVTGDSDFGSSTISSSTKNLDSSQIKSGSAATQDASGQTSSSMSTGASSGTGGGSSGPEPGTGVRPQVDAAPEYINSVTGNDMPDGTFKPKGKNLEDADETDSIPQTKTFVGAVGTVNDPGRLAERDFEGTNENPVGDLSGGGGQKNQQQGNGEGQFDVLENERA
jgi:hypothetical protein